MQTKRMKNNLALLIFLNINLTAQEYFQEEANYTIDVSFDDKNHNLKVK
jgi:hypothetical protein